MSPIYNVYCDESCHLERDHQPVMVLGAVWCPLEKSHEISVRIREIKTSHGLSPKFESKWTKVSPAKQVFYLDLLDYFFDDDDLHFRALIVPDKTKLHTSFMVRIMTPGITRCTSICSRLYWTPKHVTAFIWTLKTPEALIK